MNVTNYLKNQKGNMVTFNRHLFKENTTGLHLQRIKEMTVSSDHSTPGMKKKDKY